MMKRIIKIIFICVLLILFDKPVFAQIQLPLGYSEWDIISNNDENEISAIQYGRMLPKQWSAYQSEIPDTPYYKVGEKKTLHYAYEDFDKKHFWQDADEKVLFTWDFKEKSRVIYFYADVDAYVKETYDNYIGPPLRLYCDGKLISSIEEHDCLKNWNPKIDCQCTLLQLEMKSANSHGRNETCIVGTWATTQVDQYSYVVSWKKGSDWRFDKEYEHLYGEDSQIPTQRTVYSHPIIYNIYYDLDGGELLEEAKNTYTVLQEVKLPSAKKKGYEFISWLKDGIEISEIKKGNYGDIYLKARYERKNPNISAGYVYFDQDDKFISIDELLILVKAQAIDELDGDISKNIIVDYIDYEFDGKIRSPTYLNISKVQKVEISFSIINSGGKKANIKKNYYILGKGQQIDSLDDIKIYSRFINEKYQDTLDINSIWRQSAYQESLKNAFEKAKGD